MLTDFPFKRPCQASSVSPLSVLSPMCPTLQRSRSRSAFPAACVREEYGGEVLEVAAMRLRCLDQFKVILLHPPPPFINILTLIYITNLHVQCNQNIYVALNMKIVHVKKVWQNIYVAVHVKIGALWIKCSKIFVFV